MNGVALESAERFRSAPRQRERPVSLGKERFATNSPCGAISSVCANFDDRPVNSGPQERSSGPLLVLPDSSAALRVRRPRRARGQRSRRERRARSRALVSPSRDSVSASNSVRRGERDRERLTDRPLRAGRVGERLTGHPARAPTRSPSSLEMSPRQLRSRSFRLVSATTVAIKSPNREKQRAQRRPTLGLSGTCAGPSSSGHQRMSEHRPAPEEHHASVGASRVAS